MELRSERSGLPFNVFPYLMHSLDSKFGIDRICLSPIVELVKFTDNAKIAIGDQVMIGPGVHVSDTTLYPSSFALNL